MHGEREKERESKRGTLKAAESLRIDLLFESLGWQLARHRRGAWMTIAGHRRTFDRRMYPSTCPHLCVRVTPGGKLARFHVDQTGPSSGQRLRDQHVLVQLFAFSERSLGPLQITGHGLDNLLLVYLEAEKRQSGFGTRHGWVGLFSAADTSPCKIGAGDVAMLERVVRWCVGIRQIIVRTGLALAFGDHCLTAGGTLFVDSFGEETQAV